MAKILIIITSTILLLVLGCSAPDCSTNYFPYKSNDCCLDQNHNLVCDRDETPEQQQAIDKTSQNIQTTKALIETSKNSSNLTAYEIIDQALPGWCAYYECSLLDTLNDVRTCRDYRWFPLPGCSCRTDNDCVECLDHILTSKKGIYAEVPSQEANKFKNDILNKSLTCKT